MAYLRVIPRDLFNEASLLKMLGALWIRLENLHPDYSASVPGMGPDANRDHGDDWAGGFEIEQDPASGAIYAVGFDLLTNGLRYRLERPLNSREPWPLYATDPEGVRDEIEVFDDQGNLSPEILGAMRKDF